MGYKLVYFNLKGRAEIIRLVFAAAGVEYEDVRVPRDQWPSLKPDTPFGQMPYLEFDGMRLCQSNTIARFLAKRFGFASTDDIGAARENMIVDCTEDMRAPLRAMFFAPNPETKASLLKDYQDKLPQFLDKLEQLLSNSDGKTPFIGEKMSWADMQLANVLSYITGGSTVTCDIDYNKYTKLGALKTAVETEPKIAAWIAKRPKTDL